MAHKIEPFISMVFVVPGFVFFSPSPPSRLSWAEILASRCYQLAPRSKDNLEGALQAQLLGLITNGEH